jgi:hypothetical protein
VGALGQPSLLGFLLASVLWLLLGVVPGLLVATWLVPGRSRLERLAAAPLVSIALGFAPAAWLSALGVPQAAQAAWVVPVAVSAALVVALGRRGDLRGLVARSRTADLVGLAVAASTAVWLLGISLSRTGWSTVVPDQDGGSHGVFVTRILLTGSVSPDQVAVFDVADPSAATVFYPLGLHALAAPVAALTSVASALLVPLTVLGSASLVVGSAALASRLGGPRPVVPAAFAAGVLVPWFPFGLASAGLVPMVLALACLPGLVLALLAVRERRAVAIASLATAGMLALHVTEAVVAVGLVVLAVLLGETHPRARALVAVIGPVALGCIVVAPVVVGLLTGGAARAQDSPHGGDPLGLAMWAALRPAMALEAWRDPTPALMAIVLLAACLVMALVVAGAVRVHRSPLGVSVVIVVVGSLAVGALARIGAAGPLSIPWYGNSDRLAAQAAALVPVLLGAGWVQLRGREARAVRVLTAVGAVAVAGVLVLQALASTVDAFSRFVAGPPDDRAAYAWLAAHVGPGERVLNDHQDGSLWVYDASRGAVAPVFGPKPSGGWDLLPSFDGAVRLRDHITELGTDGRLRADAAALGVRYVLVGSRTFFDVQPQIDAAALEASPAFREVFRSGDARVFEIVAR